MKRIFILLVSLVFFSCSMVNRKSEQMSWKYETIGNGLTQLSSSDDTVVKHLSSLYASNPHEPDYKELSFDKLLLNDTTGFQYYVFDVLYVDDMKAVFVIDQQGEVINNFLLSEFQ